MQDQVFLSWSLGLIAALLHAIGYFVYNRQVKKRDSAPNFVSWTIWSGMAGLNFFSFKEITNLAKALQYAVGTLAAGVTWFNCLRWGTFAWPSKREIKIGTICIFATISWKAVGDPSLGNFIFLIAFAISFKPTFDGVRATPTKERPHPWLWWTAAYVVNMTNVLLSWNGNWMSVANPIFLGLCHASIAFLSRESRVHLNLADR